MIDDFLSSCDGKIEALDVFYQKEDWHAYEVAVHALKSTLKLLGLSETSEEARALEEAAGNTDPEFIRENHARFLKNVRDIVNRIRRKG